jgi:hypothetical protein
MSKHNPQYSKCQSGGYGPSFISAWVFTISLIKRQPARKADRLYCANKLSNLDTCTCF